MAQKGMHDAAFGENSGHDNPARGRHNHAASRRIGTQGKGKNAGDQAGGGVVPACACPAPLKQTEGECEAYEAQAKCDVARQQAADASQPADEREGADAGDAGAVRSLAGLPAAFDADQQPDRRSETRPLKNFYVAHPGSGVHRRDKAGNIHPDQYDPGQDHKYTQEGSEVFRGADIAEGRSQVSLPDFQRPPWTAAPATRMAAMAKTSRARSLFMAP